MIAMFYFFPICMLLHSVLSKPLCCTLFYEVVVDFSLPLEAVIFVYYIINVVLKIMILKIS